MTAEAGLDQLAFCYNIRKEWAFDMGTPVRQSGILPGTTMQTALTS
jgi:hypothetical protein